MAFFSLCSSYFYHCYVPQNEEAYSRSCFDSISLKGVIVSCKLLYSSMNGSYWSNHIAVEKLNQIPDETKTEVNYLFGQPVGC